MTLSSRFREKVDDSGGPNACWPWTGYVDAATGYGRFGLDHSRVTGAHRVAYELAAGPIPDGIQIDHLCRNRACVNPAHLQAVTHAENVRRGNGGLKDAIKTHCPSGHAYDEANTYRIPSRPNARYCKACGVARRRPAEAVR